MSQKHRTARPMSSVHITLPPPFIGGGEHGHRFKTHRVTVHFTN